MMWIIFFVVAIVIIAADYLLLNFYDAYLYKYFVVMHLTFLVVNLSVLLLFQYLKKNHSEYVGLGIMAGLVFKMFIALGIFVVLYNKLQLSDIQAINFLFVYFFYTVVFLIQLLKSRNLKI